MAEIAAVETSDVRDGQPGGHPDHMRGQKGGLLARGRARRRGVRLVAFPPRIERGNELKCEANLWYSRGDFFIYGLLLSMSSTLRLYYIFFHAHVLTKGNVHFHAARMFKYSLKMIMTPIECYSYSLISFAENSYALIFLKKLPGRLMHQGELAPGDEPFRSFGKAATGFQ